LDASNKYKGRLIIMLSIILKVPTPTTTPRFNDLIFILNPNSQGGATGKNWSATYEEIKKFLPRQHRIVFTRKLMTRQS
jgi:hypothetical protein